ncbi:MAG TPA: hypothetical protein VF519_08640 [Mycobacteriales bacterium]
MHRRLMVRAAEAGVLLTLLAMAADRSGRPEDLAASQVLAVVVLAQVAGSVGIEFQKAGATRAAHRGGAWVTTGLAVGQLLAIAWAATFAATLTVLAAVVPVALEAFNQPAEALLRLMRPPSDETR